MVHELTVLPQSEGQSPNFPHVGAFRYNRALYQELADGLLGPH